MERRGSDRKKKGRTTSLIRGRKGKRKKRGGRVERGANCSLLIPLKVYSFPLKGGKKGGLGGNPKEKRKKGRRSAWFLSFSVMD